MAYCKRLKTATVWGLLLLIACSALVPMIVAVQSVPVNAVKINGTEQGDRKSMYKKIAYGAFENCINDANKVNLDYGVINGLSFDVGPINLGKIGQEGIESSKLRSGRWFAEKKVGDNALGLLDTREAYSAGGLLEYKLTGKYDDGKIYCGENSNALMTSFVDDGDYLNLKNSHEDVFCKGDEFLILGRGSSGSCHETFNDQKGYFLSPMVGGLFYDNNIAVANTSQEDYLDKLVKDKSFAGDVPGGSLYELTDLEQYFLLNDTFLHVCAKDEPASDDSSLGYGVFIRDQQSGELVKKYFPEASEPSKNTKFTIRKKGDANVKMSCKEIAETLANEDSAEMKAYKEYIKEVPVEEEDPEPVTMPDDDICFDNSGALGWVVCPLIEAGSEIASFMYDEIETDFLQLQVGKMFEQDGGLESVWRMFRDMANVVFIIFFLVVIFSQLTGIGIDNYGIKKILPKLIVVAIVMNLSFLLCALAADISNILGLGLNQMFTSMATQIRVTTVSPTISGSIAAGGLVAGGTVLFVILTNPAAAVSFAGVAVAVGIAVLGIVISLGISIFFMYLALMVRDMGIILLIAVSPVAIVCYMLPNMDKMAKKWYEMLKALLLVYPICGALIGAGKLAGRLLASFDTPAFAVAGMIAEVVPFFMIPKILKASLQLMGNVGARLMATGRSLGRRGAGATKGAITGSRRYQDWSSFNKDQAAYKNAKKIRDRLGKRTQLTEAQRNRYARAQHAAAAYESGREKMYVESFKRNSRGDNQKEFANALAGKDAQRATAGLSTLLSQGGISEALGALSDENLDWDNMDQNVKSDMIQAMGASGVDVMKGYSKYLAAGGSASFSEWSKGELTSEHAAKDSANRKLGAGITSYASYLAANGPSAMNGYSKDEMEYVKNNSSEIRKSMNNDSAFGTMLANAAVYSKDERAKTMAEEAIKDQLSGEDGNEKMDLKDLNLTAQMFGDMREQTAQAIYDGALAANGNSDEAATQAMHEAFGTQAAGIESDNRLKNQIKPGVGQKIGVRSLSGGDGGGEPVPGPVGDASTSGAEASRAPGGNTEIHIRGSGSNENDGGGSNAGSVYADNPNPTEGGGGSTGTGSTGSSGSGNAGSTQTGGGLAGNGRRGSFSTARRSGSTSSTGQNQQGGASGTNSSRPRVSPPMRQGVDPHNFPNNHSAQGRVNIIDRPANPGGANGLSGLAGANRPSGQPGANG